MRICRLIVMCLCLFLSGCIGQSFQELPTDPIITIESAPHDSTLVAEIILTEDTPYQSVNLWVKIDNVSGFWCGSNTNSEVECTIQVSDSKIVASHPNLGSFCTELRCEWQVEIYYLGVLIDNQIIIQFS